MFFENLLPRLVEVFCPLGILKITLQWNNAKPHWDSSNRICQFMRIIYKNGCNLKINLVNQPARSPDFNICDLGINNVLQTLQWHYLGKLKTVKNIIQAINYA